MSEQAKPRTVSIGAQSFAEIRRNGCFYIDKTDFIRQWWESQDAVTLITRPRRFGKTLTMSMVEGFFSPQYREEDLFDGLDISRWERCDELRGQVPVIFVTFAGVKPTSFESFKIQIKQAIYDIILRKGKELKSGRLDSDDLKIVESIRDDMSDETAMKALNQLCYLEEKLYSVKPILLMDEYDTPMQEAWMVGYWDEAAQYMRVLFNSTFKTNPYLDRAIITGITRITKESMFSDLNNLKVVTTSTERYETCFGFTEGEVFSALDEFGMGNLKHDVKHWYDGYKFGNVGSIYNPWSITYFLDANGRFDAYWANTAGTGLISRLVSNGAYTLKYDLEQLLQGGTIETELDEQVVFNQLDDSDQAVWSLLLAAGYLAYDRLEEVGENKTLTYTLRLVNFESRKIFSSMVNGWFHKDRGNYGRFIRMLLADDLEGMSDYLGVVIKESFSFFDTGENAAESFYHAFVLGMVVDLRADYAVDSNKESGFGRYDVCICPKDPDSGLCGYVMEFKLRRPDREADLKETLAHALEQIESRQYAQGLVQKGVPAERIRKYGFAFEGKQVIIGKG